MRRREAGRIGGGAGEQAYSFGGGRPAIPGLAGAAPALPARNRHPGGVGAPPGDTTIPCQELADDRRARFAPSVKARPGAGVRTPQQSAERRAGPRHGPVISGDPEIGPLARRATGCGVPHQRLSALCSPRFFKGAETDKGIPAPHEKPGGEALAV